LGVLHTAHQEEVAKLTPEAKKQHINELLLEYVLNDLDALAGDDVAASSALVNVVNTFTSIQKKDKNIIILEPQLKAVQEQLIDALKRSAKKAHQEEEFQKLSSAYTEVGSCSLNTLDEGNCFFYFKLRPLGTHAFSLLCSLGVVTCVVPSRTGHNT